MAYVRDYYTRNKLAEGAEFFRIADIEREKSKSFDARECLKMATPILLDFTDHLYPCVRCCPLMHSIFIAKQILQDAGFRQNHPWAASYDKAKHEIVLSSKDILFLSNPIQKIENGVLGWILYRKAHFGRVFAPIGYHAFVMASKKPEHIRHARNIRKELNWCTTPKTIEAYNICNDAVTMPSDLVESFELVMPFRDRYYESDED
jgi:hypothetical protein